MDHSRALQSIQGKLPGSSIFHRNDGFFFYCDKQVNGTNYYRCWVSRSQGCPVRAKQRIGGDFQVTGIHLDEPNPLLIPYLTERLVLINQARRLDISSVHEVFQDPVNSSQMFGSLLNYHRLSPAMGRARIQSLPQPQSLSELVEVLENPAFACISSIDQFMDSAYARSFQHADGSSILLFMSRKCTEFMRVVPHLFILHTTISPQHHMCTIGAFWERSMVQLAWCLTDAAITEETFANAFLLLKSHLSTWHFTSAVCGDNQVARAFHSIFAVEVNTSLYDYIQELKVFLKGSRASSEAELDIQTQQHMLHTFQLCCALPLLPQDKLVMGINVIMSQASTISRLPHNDLQRVISYIQTQWLYHPLKGRVFSVCGNSNRTNYGREELKSKIALKLHNFDGSFHMITKYIVSSSETSHKAIRKIAQGIRPNPVLPLALSECDELRRIIANMIRPPLPIDVLVKNYLTVASQKLLHVIGMM